MPSLRDVQQHIVHSIVHRDDAPLDLLIAADGLAASDRLAIYRNTFISVLTRALRLAYPAVARLVGDGCFEGLAQRFIAEQPPSCAWLDRYGERFAALLAS